MTEQERDREIPEQVESETRRATGMGDPGSFEEGDTADPAASLGDGPGPLGEPRDGGTRRATGMGEPGTLPSDRGPVAKARHMAGGRLQEAAGRVRELGDQTAARNRLLGPTRPLAHNAADRIEDAAEYVRTRELDEMRSDLETTVRRHPLASVAVAFFAGYSLRRIF